MRIAKHTALIISVMMLFSTLFISVPINDNPVGAESSDPESYLVERGQNWDKYYNPSTNQYTLTSTIGAINYEDETGWNPIDTTLMPSMSPWNWEMVKSGYNAYLKNDFTAGQVVQFEKDGEYVTLQPHALQYSNDLDQIQQISMPQDVTPTTNDNEIKWVDAYGTGLNFTWTCGNTRLAKLLIIDNESRLPDVEQYILDGGNPVLELNLIFGYSSGVDAYVDGELWNQKDQKDTYDYIEFRDSNGTVLWGFEPAYSWDSNDSRTPMTVRLKKQGNSFFVSLRLNYSWLENAVFPVYVDADISEQVTGSTDDGHENNGAVDTTSTKFGYYVSDADYGYHLWDNIVITKSSTISSCVIQHYCDPPTTQDDPHTIDYYFNDVASPSTLAGDANEISSKAKTTNFVSDTRYNVGSGWDTGIPDLTVPLQELVNSYATSGIAVIGFKDESTNYVIRTADYTGSYGAKIDITYIPAPPTITNPSPTNQSIYQSTNPTLSVLLNQTTGTTMNCTWYWSSDGVTYNYFASNSSITDGTYYQTNSNFTELATRYYWNVSVDDGTGTNDAYYWFVTTPYINISNCWNDSFDNPQSYIKNKVNMTISGDGYANFTGISDSTDWANVDDTQYCAYDPTNGYMGIERVELNTLDKSSSMSDTQEDYTNTGTNLTIIGSYEIFVTVESNYDQTVNAWIDWDDSEAWGAWEWVGTNTFTNDGERKSLGSFVVPSNATTTAFAMRVMSQFEGNWSGACPSADYGDCEDYSIAVYPFAIDANITSVNITKEADMTWDKLYVTINDTASANVMFSILDENGTAQLTGLNGDGNDISSVTNNTIQIYGLFNTSIYMSSWNVTWTEVTTVTYYFDDYDTGEAWDNSPEDMADGDEDAYANTDTSNDIELLNNNTCTGTNLGTITSVDIRGKGYYSGVGSHIIRFRPVFAGGDGDTHSWNTVPSSGDWSPWYNITTDTNAPSPWTWSAVDGLDCDVVSSVVGVPTKPYVYCSKVEIRVNYSEAVENNLPTQTGESPTNGSTEVSLTPSLHVICNDVDGGDTLTATMRSNSSGPWVHFATNTSISPETNITQTNSNFSVALTTYWWSVNLTDGTDWCNETYHFTTITTFIWIDITNASWALGNIVMATSTWTNNTVTFVADKDNCTVATDLKLQITSEDDWTAATSGNGPDANTYRLNASIDTWSTEFQIVTASATTISSNIAADQNESFDLRFDAPTTSSTGDQQSVTVTATLVQH